MKRIVSTRIASHASVHSASDGDLWPSTWADDGALYAAHGDGTGFATGPVVDIGVNRVTGDPHAGLDGVLLAVGDAVAPVWGDPSALNRKPTGIVAVDGNGDGRDELYLAVQDLPLGGPEIFNQAPTASIVRSDDYGRTWTPTDAPMFTDHTFTTVMFVDHGRSNMHATRAEGCRGFVYAVGLDHNWRTSYSRTVPDPVDLYLARVKAGSVQSRDAWQFYSGHDAAGPRWSTIENRSPVLHDERRLYNGATSQTPHGQTVLAQGGVVYNPGLDCYLYTSWSEHTFQFYAAAHLWGPWGLVLEHDFGPYPWRGPADPNPHHGGYGTTIPSKFITDDGTRLWVQSNWFYGSPGGPGGDNTYHFNLRELTLTVAP